MLIPSLIFWLDYYPLSNITYHKGYCTNMQNVMYLDNSIIYYNTDIYDAINGTYVGYGNGGFGTDDNSYIANAGKVSGDTHVFPYSGYQNNIPAWLCSYAISGSQLWKTLNNNNNDDDKSLVTAIWGDETWIPCKYASLKNAQKSPWNIKKVARVRNNDWLAVTSVYDSTYTPLNETDHYITAIVFMAILGGCLFLHTIYILIHCYKVRVVKPTYDYNFISQK